MMNNFLATLAWLPLLDNLWLVKEHKLYVYDVYVWSSYTDFIHFSCHPWYEIKLCDSWVTMLINKRDLSSDLQIYLSLSGNLMDFADAREIHDIWYLLCWGIHFKEHTDMPVTKAVYLRNRNAKNPDDKKKKKSKQINGIYRKLQEKRRGLSAYYSKISTCLDSTLVKDTYSSRL